MCKHKLRSMIKPQTLKAIAAWEFWFWLLICLWVVTWHRNLDREQVFKSYVEELGYGTKEQRDTVEEHFNENMDDWDNGVWVQGLTSFLFVPIAGLLYLGVLKRSRFLVVFWMLTYLSVSLVRLWAIVEYTKAFGLILVWLQCYWIFRVYFLLCAGNYCLDLWSEATNAEPLEVPLLIPVDDPRTWRGMQNYPEYPMTLDQRPKVYGIGKHIPMHLDWRFITYPYPGWYESVDEHGKPVLVIDTPGYDPDTR